MLIVRELGCELAQRAVGGRQRRGAPVADHGVDERIGVTRVGDRIGDLGPEVVGVGLGSVVAGELGGYDDGE